VFNNLLSGNLPRLTHLKVTSMMLPLLQVTEIVLTVITGALNEPFDLLSPVLVKTS